MHASFSPAASGDCGISTEAPSQAQIATTADAASRKGPVTLPMKPTPACRRPRLAGVPQKRKAVFRCGRALLEEGGAHPESTLRHGLYPSPRVLPSIGPIAGRLLPPNFPELTGAFGLLWSWLSHARLL